MGDKKKMSDSANGIEARICSKMGALAAFHFRFIVL
jgi:hypothetical protein